MFFLNQFVLLIACQVPLIQQLFLVSGIQLDSDTHSFQPLESKQVNINIKYFAHVSQRRVTSYNVA